MKRYAEKLVEEIKQGNRKIKYTSKSIQERGVPLESIKLMTGNQVKALMKKMKRKEI